MLNYVNRVLVGLAAGTDSNHDTLATLVKGDMLVLDSNLTPITSAPSDNLGPRQAFYVAVGTGETSAPFILSSKIYGDKVTSYLGKTNVASASQVSYLGFNGTGGDIGTIVADADYEVVIAFKDRLRLLANRQSRMVLATRASSTSKFDLLEDLVAASQFDTPYTDPFGVKVEVVSDGTDIISDNNITVTNGVKDIVFTSAATYNTGTAFAVDDYIAIDDVLYQIDAVSSLTITLSRPFQGASGTVLAANVDHVASPANFGLKVTALDSPLNNPSIDVYEKVVFELGVWDSTIPVTYSTVATLGQGQYEQIKKMEFDAQAYLGNTNLRQWPIPTFPIYAVGGTSYDVIQITSYDEHEGDLQNQMKSPVGLTIAFADAGSNAQRDNITPILDALIPKQTALDGTW